MSWFATEDGKLSWDELPAEFLGTNWYCSCGCEFHIDPFAHEEARCPECGKILLRSGGEKK
jgi:hypothetical protein